MNITPTVNKKQAKQGTGIAWQNKNLAPRLFRSTARTIKRPFLFGSFVFVGEKDEKKTKCVAFYAFIVRLTFSLLDGGGLVGGAWVCVALATATTSATGVRAPSVSSLPGLFSAAVSTARRARDNRREFGGVGLTERGL